MDRLLGDVRFALRTLHRHPGFAAVVFATIGLAIGANTVIFTVVDRIALRPLPFPDSERVVVLSETNPKVGDYRVASPVNVADWARESRTIDSFGVARSESFVLDRGGERTTIRGAIVTPGWFEVQGVRASRGRLLRDSDLLDGSNHVAVLSDAFWKNRFGADPGIVGRTVPINGAPFEIIGVLPPDAWIYELGDAEAWFPLTASIDDVTERAWRGFSALGRLAPGIGIEKATEELRTIRDGLASEYPEANRDWGVRVEPLRDSVAGPIRPILLTFAAAVVFVLLIACVNVANLLIARAITRRQELAVRSSLGAEPSRIAAQMLVESLVLAAGGGVVGVGLAKAGLALFVAWAPPGIPRLDEVGIDGRILAFSFGLTLVTALLFGLLPALRASSIDPVRDLSGARGSSARRAGGLRGALVVGELALALVLLVGAALMSRAFGTLLAWNPGFEQNGLVTVFAFAPPDRVPDGEQVVELFERAARAIEGLPGVVAVGQTSAGPLFGGHERTTIALDGGTPEGSDAPSVRWMDIAPDYFATIGIPVLRGRNIAASDTASSPRVVVINETMAKRFWPGHEPLGMQVRAEDQSWEVVGVVRDTAPFRPDEPVEPQMYWPKRQSPRWGTFFIIRSNVAAGALERIVRERLGEAAPDIQLGTFRAMDELRGRQLVSPRFNVMIVALFALVALVLAAIGTYGVISFAVGARAREMAIRIALGAHPARIVRDVVIDAMRIAILGLVIGLGAALALTRLLRSMLYGLSPLDPLSYAAVLAVFVAVTLAACLPPARRASTVDPMATLKAE